MRSRLFGHWFEGSNTKLCYSTMSTSLVDADGVVNEATIIVRNDNPNMIKLINEFSETAQLLSQKPWRPSSLTVFLNLKSCNCLARLTDTRAPYAIRAQCIKLAYEQMKYYPELLTELKAALDMLEQEALSPGLASAKRQVMKKIKKALP